jgi:hypothetical protein
MHDTFDDVVALALCFWDRPSVSRYGIDTGYWTGTLNYESDAPGIAKSYCIFRGQTDGH